MAIGAKLVAVIPNQAVLYVGNPKEAEFVLGDIKRLTTWQSFEKRQPFKANVRLDERRMQESGCQADAARPDDREVSAWFSAFHWPGNEMLGNSPSGNRDFLILGAYANRPHFAKYGFPGRMGPRSTRAW